MILFSRKLLFYVAYFSLKCRCHMYLTASRVNIFNYIGLYVQSIDLTTLKLLFPARTVRPVRFRVGYRARACVCLCVCGVGWPAPLFQLNIA